MQDDPQILAVAEAFLEIPAMTPEFGREHCASALAPVADAMEELEHDAHLAAARAQKARAAFRVIRGGDG
jgi:hypothetical protein